MYYFVEISYKYANMFYHQRQGVSVLSLRLIPLRWNLIDFLYILFVLNGHLQLDFADIWN